MRYVIACDIEEFGTTETMFVKLDGPFMKYVKTIKETDFYVNYVEAVNVCRKLDHNVDGDIHYIKKITSP